MRSIPKTASSPRRNLPLSLAAAVAMVLGGQGPAKAGNLYWDTNATGTGATSGTTAAGIWGTDNFWSTDSTGVSATGAYVDGSDVIFSAGTNAIGGSAITVSGTQIANSITLEEGTVTIGTPGSGGLSLGAGGFTMNAGLTGNAVVSTNLAGGILLTASQQWTNNTIGKTLTVNAQVKGGALTGNTFTLTVSDAGGSTSIGSGGNGGITDGSNGGNLALVKTGAGKLTLGANTNSYTGGTTINGGVLQFGTGTNSVPATGAVTINTSGTLVAAGPGTFNTVDGWLKSGKIATSSSGVIGIATSTSNQAIDFLSSGYSDLYLGSTAANAVYTGTLTPGTNGYLLGGGGGTLTVNSALDQNATLTVDKSATVVLGGNNSYNGLTTVNSGTLVVNHANALGSTAAGTTVNPGASLALGDGVITNPGENVTIAGTGQNLGALTTVAGNLAPATWQGTVTLGDSGARVGARAGTTLNISGAILGSGTNQDLIISGESNTNGTGVIIISAAAGTNAYTGATKIVRGIVKIGAENALPTGTLLDVDSSSAPEDSTFDLNGSNQTVGGLTRSNVGGGAGGSYVTNNGASIATLTVGGGGAYTYNGTLQDGSSPLAVTKSGSGSLTLSGTTNYSGSTTVNAGALTFGSTNTGSTSVTINGGTLLFSGTSSGNTPLIVNAGTATVSGSMAGNSPFTVNGGSLAVTGSNASTATTTLNNGTLQLSGAAGILASTNFQLNGGTFTIDNTGSGNNNNTRIADTASFTLNGGSFIYKGSDQAGINSAETLGSIVLGRGLSTLSVERGTGNTADLTASDLTRSAGGGIALIKGTSLGQLFFTTAPTLVGNGAGTKDAKIVPYLLGSSTNGTADTFVTYDAATGLRPLGLATEFDNPTTISGIVAGSNVRITAGGLSTNGNTPINSLILAVPNNGIFTVGASQTLTIASGALLFTGLTSNINGPGTLAFGREAIITSAAQGTSGIIGAKITGTNGLSFFGAGSLALTSGESIYSGETVLSGGTIAATASSTSVGGVVTKGPFGTSTVVFAGSQFRNSISATQPTTIGNALRFQSDTTFIPGGSRVVFSGPVTLDGGTRTLTNSTTKGVTFSGVIGDGAQAAGLTIATTTPTADNSIILSGNNTYTGPTTVKSGTVEVSGTIGGSSSVSVNNSGSLILSGTASDRIADTTPVTLGTSGATTGDATFGINNSALGGAFSENVGKLTLASNAVLDLGTGDFGTIMHFADSSSSSWTGTLKIYNWTGSTDHLFFGNSMSGLTPTQVSQVLFYSDAGTAPLGSGMILTSGEMVPVPEPSTLLGGAALLGFLGWRERRKIGRVFSRKS